MSGLSKVKSGGLATGCVSADAIATGAVTAADIPDGEVTGAKIENDVALGGNPTTTTQTAGNNTTRIATTAFVTTAVGAISQDAIVTPQAAQNNRTFSTGNNHLLAGPVTIADGAEWTLTNTARLIIA